jgi:ACS family allantoate permease-like MFS transporter
LFLAVTVAELTCSIVARDDADELLAPPSLKETKALLRKADLIIVTLLQFALSWSLHCIQNADHTVMGSVDKVAIGSAAVLGMRKDAKLVGQEYAWTSAIIYFGGELVTLRRH